MPDSKNETRKRLIWRWGSPRQEEGARVIRMEDAAKRLRRTVEDRRPEPTPPAAPARRAS